MTCTTHSVAHIAEMGDFGVVFVDPFSRRAWRVIADAGIVFPVEKVGSRVVVPIGPFGFLRGDSLLRRFDLIVRNGVSMDVIADIVYRVSSVVRSLSVIVDSETQERRLTSILPDVTVHRHVSPDRESPLQRAIMVMEAVRSCPHDMLVIPSEFDVNDRILEGIEDFVDMVACIGMRCMIRHVDSRGALEAVLQALAEPPLGPDEKRYAAVRAPHSNLSELVTPGISFVASAAEIRKALWSDFQTDARARSLLEMVSVGLPVAGGRGFRLDNGGDVLLICDPYHGEFVVRRLDFLSVDWFIDRLCDILDAAHAT